MRKNNLASFDTAMYGVALVLAGLVLPLFLIVPIHYLGASAVLEEVAKLLVVLFCIMKLPTRNQQILGALLFGFLFALSEHALYFSQIFRDGTFQILWLRLMWVTPLYMLTPLVLLGFARAGKWGIPVGVALAIAAHLAFNYIVPGLLVRV